MTKTIKQLTLINPKLKSLLIVIFLLSFKVKAESYKKCFNDYDIEKLSLERVINTNKYLIEKGGGEVYLYDGCDRLDRIDKSFAFKNRYGSLNFEFNNALFSFGGYGLFQFNNSLITFDRDYGKWKLYFPNSQNSAPKARRYMIGGIHKNELIIGPGTSEKYNQETLEISSHFSKDFWAFNLVEKTWSKLYDGEDITITSNSRIFNLGRISIISDHEISIIDYVSKTIKVFDNPKRDVFHNADKVELQKGNLIILSSDEVLILPLEKLEEGNKKTIQLHSPLRDKTTYLLVFIFTMITAFIFLRYKFQNRKNWHKKLSEQQLMILKKLESSDGPVYYKDLYTLYDSEVNFETLKGKLRRDLKKIELDYYNKYKKSYLVFSEDPNDRRSKMVKANKGSKFLRNI